MEQEQTTTISNKTIAFPKSYSVVWFHITIQCYSLLFWRNNKCRKLFAHATTYLKPQLTQKRKLSSTIFIQVGGLPHFASTVIQFLIRTFTQERLISRGCNLVWPSRSPDLNPLDYWFWGTLKARIFHTNPPTTIQTLKSVDALQLKNFQRLCLV